MKESRQQLIEQLRRQKRLGIRALLLGVVLMLIGIPFFVQSWRFNASAIRAAGKIVQLEQLHGGKDASYIPVFSFVDQAGGSHVIHSRLGSSHPRYAVGDVVGVLYPANDPEQARLNSFFALWLWPIVFGGAGLLLVVAGILLWYGAVTAPVDELAAAGQSES